MARPWLGGYVWTSRGRVGAITTPPARRLQNHGLHPRVAETRAREQRVEAPRRVALGQVAGEAGDGVVADDVPCCELARDDARAVDDDPPDRHRLTGG
jgi:hypothetical protein